jgi:iron complex transport system substrate-binding protein
VTRLASWLCLVCLTCALLACKRDRAGEAAPDATSPEIARVVSLSPSTTEAMFAIGQGAKLVGRSRYCDYPEAVRAIPEVGGYVDPSYEAILALRPDLVIGARGPAGRTLTDKLEARGVRTYFPPAESFDDVEKMMSGLGDLVGASDGAARAVSTMRAEIAVVEARARAKPKVRVLLLFGLDPAVAAGPGTLADEMLRRLGAVNVVDKGTGYPVLGVERVLALDPDVIVNGAMGGKKTPPGPDTPGWGKVRAVDSGHVSALADERALRPGPRLGGGLDALDKAIDAARPGAPR